ncbi:MAG: hypothetical protein CVT67_00365 [Actinobacteria bacterium HGW-Actinobacteria-7]|jgi:ADP-ribose pyrophosphatase YjhB (NUDIX family)|nr:MAG: hypothetical protein CVT67_00365 [Actinobacteria bacterium HGW-Actinobacteria-7]
MLLEGKVVTVRHRAGSSVYHLLPGGGVDYRETLAQALIREVKEETGLEVTVGAPALLSDTIDPSGSRHVVNVTFLANVTGGTVVDSPDDDRVEAVDLVDPDRLSDLDLRPPMASAVVRVLNGDNVGLEYLGPLFTEAT